MTLKCKHTIVQCLIRPQDLVQDYHVKMATNWHYGTIDDLAKAARDWPKSNFIISQLAIQTGEEFSKSPNKEFEKSA